MAKPFYPKLHKAIKVAVKAHKKQDRDGSHPLPYVTHPIEVVSLVRLEAGIEDEAILCAAVLHDVLEETDVTAEDIEEDFGATTLDIVRELTREDPPADKAKLPESELWQVKNEMMMEEIDRMSPTAKTIKLADRLSNLRSNLKTRTGEKRDRYVRQSREILNHIDRKISPALWDQIDSLLPREEAVPLELAKADGAAPKQVRKHHTNGAKAKSAAKK